MRRYGSEITHRRIWQLALPMMISNITVPLLGAVDTAVVGHLDQSHYLGAVAVGAMIFSFVYWGFGFLRMGTTGFVAQAYGAGNGAEVRASFARALALGAVIGVALIALQGPIIWTAFTLLDGSAEVEGLGATYVAIRIWGAPAAMANYALLALFIGLHNTRAVLVLQLATNGVNIVLDLLFVIGFGWGVAGVAAATLIAEYAAVGVGLWLAVQNLKGVAGALPQGWVRDGRRFGEMMRVNGDIFVRSFCLILAFSLFTAAGARQGNDVLAANAVVMNLIQIMAYGLDGFAYAAEALVGSAFGAGDRAALRRAVKLTMIWSLIFALGYTLLFAAAGSLLVRLLTGVPEVLALSNRLVLWAAATPAIAVWCYLFDGVYVGAMRSADMRNGMVISFLVYLAALHWLPQAFGNDGLWAALMVFFALRGLTLAVRYPALERSVNNIRVKA